MSTVKSTRQGPVFWASLCAALLPFAALAQAPAPAPAAPASPTERLTQTVQKVSKLDGMEVRFHQETYTPGRTVTMTGRLIGAADKKVRYELETEYGVTRSTFRIISDGTQVWQITLVKSLTPDSTKEPVPVTTLVQNYELAKLEDALKALEGGQDKQVVPLEKEKVEELRQNVLREHGFEGIAPALKDLQERIVFNKEEKTTLNLPKRENAPVIVLDGEWNKATRDKMAPPKSSLADPKAPDDAATFEKRQSHFYIPRRCRLYLDAQTGYPVRLDWLGPKKYEGPDEVIIRLDWEEFTPVPAERLAGMFKIDPKLDKDVNPQEAKPFDITAFLQNRRRMLAQRQQMEADLANRRPLDPAGAPGSKPGPP